MKKIFWVLLGLIAAGSLFVSLPKVHASSPDIVISEVMYNCFETDTKCEWVEIFNPADYSTLPIDITGWKFNDGANHGLNLNAGESKILISSGEYLILASDRSTFLTTHTGFTGQVIDTVMDLNNTTDTVSIINQSLVEVDSLTYFSSWGGNGNKKTLERNDFDLSNDVLNWHESATDSGTPGQDNSLLLPPDKSNLIAPLNNAVIVGTKSVDFEWSEVTGPTYSLIISKNSDLSDPIADESALDWGKFYWAVEAKENGLISLSDIWSFELQKPVYSKNIIVNEILSHPSTGVNNEFIELFNTGATSVDLSGWFLDDVDGGSSPYEIPFGTVITPGGYLIFLKSQTGLSLNDTGDMARLMNPDSEIASETLFGEADLDLAWARGPDGVWSWTNTMTPGGLNIVTAPIADPPPTEETEPVINSVPIEIAIGDYENYLDKLVKIKGKVTSTSGSTFYLDDGSGVVKVYIQSKTGIKKPEMHKNDIFEIIGIVDIYGQTWRILPVDQDDIKLIELAAKIIAKKTTVKKVTAEVKAATLSPVLSTAKAAGTETSDKKKTSDTFNQLVKLITFLAIIVFMIFFVRIWNRREKSIGGHFGDDET